MTWGTEFCEEIADIFDLSGMVTHVVIEGKSKEEGIQFWDFLARNYSEKIFSTEFRDASSRLINGRHMVWIDDGDTSLVGNFIIDLRKRSIKTFKSPQGTMDKIDYYAH